MRRILVATDMTRNAHEALGRASVMAREAGAELRVIYAPPASADQDECSIARSRLRDELAAFPGAPATFELDLSISMPRTEPVDAILDEAERFRPDLIILGGHPEPRFLDVILGTTATHLAREARPPVLIAQTDHDMPYRKLLAAIDENSAEQVLRVALGILSATDLFVVHAHESAGRDLSGAGELLDDVRTDQEVLTREVLEVVHTLRRSTANPQIHHIVEKGDAIDVIIRAWTKVAPDLLVMGTRGRAGLSRLLGGSHAETVLLGCPTDILITRTHSR